jgi:hypothetical protein
MDEMKMKNERFFDLAMKVIARQAGDAERAELEALLADDPDLRTEFARLEADARMAREVLPILGAVEASAGELPPYARGRLQTKVRQTLGRPAVKQDPDRSMAWNPSNLRMPAARMPGSPRRRNRDERTMWGWWWILGLAAATAVIVLVAVPLLRAPGGPVIQVAMLDTAGAVRGTGDHDADILKQQWKNSSYQNFDTTAPMENWLTNWPAGDKPAVKVIYDRATAEVRVVVHGAGKDLQKNFPVDADLATTMLAVGNFVQEQTKR